MKESEVICWINSILNEAEESCDLIDTHLVPSWAMQGDEDYWDCVAAIEEIRSVHRKIRLLINTLGNRTLTMGD